MRTGIKIHGSVWRIRYVAAQSKYLDKGKNSACTYFDKHTIYLDKGLCKDRQEFVLLHELCHIIMDHGGLTPQVNRETEESICDAFAAFMKEYFLLRKEI